MRTARLNKPLREQQVHLPRVLIACRQLTLTLAARSAPLAHGTHPRLIHVNRERACREARATGSGWANC